MKTGSGINTFQVIKEYGYPLFFSLSTFFIPMFRCHNKETIGTVIASNELLLYLRFTFTQGVYANINSNTNLNNIIFRLLASSSVYSLHLQILCIHFLCSQLCNLRFRKIHTYIYTFPSHAIPTSS